MNQQNFSLRIQASGRTIVACDNFVVEPNTVSFLFGESGIGKSTLCKAVYGLLDPDELSATINSRPYGEHVRSEWTQAVRASSFFVFQEPSSHLNPLAKIAAQLSEGSLRKAGADADILAELFKGADQAAIDRVLDIFPKPYRPSGGEKQRILLAMAFKKLKLAMATMAKSPSLFVFDEPTGSLDDNYRNLFLGLLFEKFRATPFTAVIITHDYSIISEIYRSYQSLIGRIRFKELERTGEGHVSLVDFTPENYLSWLKGAAANRPRPAKNDVVLRVASALRIHHRDLRIFKDPGRTQPADFVVCKGSMAYLKAASGVGKTTVAKAVIGLYPTQKFTMDLCGMTVSEETSPEIWRNRIWGRHAGMVFQHADEALNLQATVAETFAGLPQGARLTGEKLAEHLRLLFPKELSRAFFGKKVAYLSGGQKQRLNVLRTLALAPDLIILDEPLNGLDFNSITRVLGLLEEKRKQGAALFMISHNEEIFDAIIDPANTYYLSAA